MQRRKLTNTNDAKMLSIEKMRQKKRNSKLNQNLYEVTLKLFYPKGQLISKCLQFLPKNERKQVDLRYLSSKVEFIRSFFGRLHGLTICFRVLLTFSMLTLLFNCPALFAYKNSFRYVQVRLLE